MRIYGQRSDGSLLVSLGGGVGVIMRGTNATKALDLGVLEKLGPWTKPEGDNADARKVAKQLDRCKTVQLSNFSLGVAGMSDNDRRSRVEQALGDRLGRSVDLYVPLNGMGDDWVVYASNGKHFGLSYAIDEAGSVAFDGTEQELTPAWENLADTDEHSIDLKGSPFFKNFKKAKDKKKLITDMPGSLPNLNPIL